MTGEGPVRAVLAGVAAGHATVAELAGATGLPADLVAAVVGHLVRTGRVAACGASTCPATGCAGCPLVRPPAAAPRT